MALYPTCTIQRRVLVQVFKWTASGQSILVSQSLVIEPCGIPLVNTQERSSGVCNSCRQGYEAPENEFANDAERQRAIKS